MVNKKSKAYHDPMSSELIELRQALGETQEQFRLRFGIGRTTLLSWERYGCPTYPIVRSHIRAVIRLTRRNLEKRRAQANKAKQAKRDTAQGRPPDGRAA